MKTTAEIQVQTVNRSRVEDVDFANLPFASVYADHMLVAEYRGGAWGDPEIRPYGPLPVPPGVSSLQYGVSVFEALKAHRSAAGDVLLFRPWENARRLNRSAARLAMPEVPEDLFLFGLRELVRLDAPWVPPAGAGALYIRPTFFSVDPSLRVKWADDYVFAIVSCPVGSYYAAPLDVLVSDRYTRAFPGGTGDVKTAGNYAPALLADREAQAFGCSTVLWLDGREKRYVEECGLMNIFFVADDRVLTPELGGTILPGVTRDSALRILRDMGLKVEERRIAIDEIVDWHRQGRLQEAFGTGTAAQLSHLARIRYRDSDLMLPPVESRKVGPALRQRLIALMTGESPDPYGWLDPVDGID
jgi:branched-chain amino acid aminotransferase